MKSITSEQSRKIQFLRGFAIIAVVFIHNTPPGIWQIVCRPFLNFAVGMFLFLSGILSSSDRWHPKQRIFKVLIPYTVWTFIYVLFSNYRTPGTIPIEYIKRLLFADSAAMMYYIFVYIQFTLLIPLIDKVAKSKYKFIPFIIAPLEIILFRLLPIPFSANIDILFRKVQAISCLPWFTFFYLGYLLGNDYIKLKTGATKLTIGLIVSIVIQMVEGYIYSSIGRNDVGTQLKLSALLTTTFVLLIAYNFVQNRHKYTLPPRICRKLLIRNLFFPFSHNDGFKSYSVLFKTVFLSA